MKKVFLLSMLASTGAVFALESANYISPQELAYQGMRSVEAQQSAGDVTIMQAAKELFGALNPVNPQAAANLHVMSNSIDLILNHYNISSNVFKQVQQLAVLKIEQNEMESQAQTNPHMTQEQSQNYYKHVGKLAQSYEQLRKQIMYNYDLSLKQQAACNVLEKMLLSLADLVKMLEE